MVCDSARYIKIHENLVQPAIARAISTVVVCMNHWRGVGGDSLNTARGTGSLANPKGWMLPLALADCFCPIPHP